MCQTLKTVTANAVPARTLQLAAARAAAGSAECGMLLQQPCNSQLEWNCLTTAIHVWQWLQCTALYLL
jgi:hypothetical protein